MTFDPTISMGTILTGIGMLSGTLLFALGVIRNINGKWSKVEVTLARIDERVKGVEDDVRRLDSNLVTVARHKE